MVIACGVAVGVHGGTRLVQSPRLRRTTRAAAAHGDRGVRLTGVATVQSTRRVGHRTTAQFTRPQRGENSATNHCTALRLFDALCTPRAHTLPPRHSTCSACRATAQVSSVGSRKLMAGLGGHVARAFRMCSWSPTGHFSGGAHTQLVRKAGDPPLSRRHGRLLPAA